VQNSRQSERGDEAQKDSRPVEDKRKYTMEDSEEEGERTMYIKESQDWHTSEYSYQSSDLAKTPSLRDVNGKQRPGY